MNADPANSDRIVIIGGGIAGLAAAVRLAEHEVPVTLVETSKKLGGRAASFTDPTTGDTLDNCQHVLMRCCTNLVDLYQRLGVEDHIDWRRTLYFADRQGHLDTLTADDLPAPLHMLRPMLAFNTLTFGDKIAVMRGMLGLLQVSRTARHRHDSETFADWLAHHRQPRKAIDRFWAPVVTSACNETPERVAASYAIQVFQEGFLYDTHNYEMGVPTVPLTELYAPAQQRIEQAGGHVMLGASADQLLYDESDNRVTYLRLSDHQEVTGRAFISALPPDRLARILPEGIAKHDTRLGSLDQFTFSPIVGIHLFLRTKDNTPIMDQPHMVLMDGQVQWVFNKGVNDGVQHLHAVISAAHDLVEQDADAITSTAVSELREALPEARGAELTHSRVIKEKHATFSAQPGVSAIRPSCEPAGGVSNLYLAGDWVDTGWPATMESAVRSGYAAAAAVLADQRIQAQPLHAPDLPPSALYRVLSA